MDKLELTPPGPAAPLRWLALGWRDFARCPKIGLFYGDYFARSRPATSYQYNEGLERISPTQTQSQEHRQISNSGANAPLLGRVIVNERMTAEGWMQDTRHMRIHVMRRGIATPRSSGSDEQSPLSTTMARMRVSMASFSGVMK